jgi:hypothetical protein
LNPGRVREEDGRRQRLGEEDRMRPGKGWREDGPGPGVTEEME